MPGIRENSPAENAIFTLQISFEIEQWNLRNRLRTLHVTDGLFWALGVPRRFAACDKVHQRGIQSIPNTLFLTIMAQVSNENMLQTN